MSSGSTPGARAPSRVHALWSSRDRLVPALLVLLLVAGLALRLNGVLHPIDSSYQGADAARYQAIAASLYERHRFGVPHSTSPYDWSPGAPLFYAGLYVLTGGVHPGLARLSIALMGLLTILIAFALGRRMRGPWTGLLAAALAAFYPAFIFNTGRLLSEPLAEVLVPAAALAFLWAAGRRAPWAWLVPGVLIGLAALARPEYLAFGPALAVLALIVSWRARGARSGLAAGVALALAFAAPIVPWAAHVSAHEGRLVPISTGGGKALFIGSYLPGDGIFDPVKIDLMKRYLGYDHVTPSQRARQPMEPVLDKVAAAHYPDMDRDAALARLGRENLIHYATHDPIALAIMMGKKMRYMWRGSSGAMLGFWPGLLQTTLILLGVVGLVALAVQRRLEAVVLGVLILGVTVFAGVVLAAPRRNLALMPMVVALAATGTTTLVALARAALAARRGRLVTTGSPLEQPGR